MNLAIWGIFDVCWIKNAIIGVSDEFEGNLDVVEA